MQHAEQIGTSVMVAGPEAYPRASGLLGLAGLSLLRTEDLSPLGHHVCVEHVGA